MFKKSMQIAVLLTAALITSLAGAQARFDFNSTPGLLSKDIRPTHYRLHFDLDPASDGFSGHTTIALKIQRATPDITIHADNLEASEVNLALETSAQSTRALRVEKNPSTQTWRLVPQDGKVIAPGRYALTLRYTGLINKTDSGLYRAPHTHQGQAKSILATQLEAVFARKLFPSFDEPAFRSVFEISVKAPSAFDVHANMPARSIKEQGKHRLHTFKPTPSMPTYLVAITVGQFETLQGQSGRVPLRIFTAPGKQAQATYAMEVTQKVLPFYKSYFGIDFALPKLDQLAVPSTRGGAMEDWGLISYAETALLFDPNNSAVHRQREVFSTVAHEVAHQWFGNLVTAASWEEIWLNEAFATWMAEKATDRFNPEWQVSLRRRQPIDMAMVKDASSATRAIRSGPVQEDRVFDVFDEITYAKGGAVLSMLEAWLGPEVFQKGLAAYMQHRQFSNATAADLWFHIGQAAGRDVGSVAKSWTDQKGFPLLQVNARCEAGRTKIQIQQQRFATDAQAVDQSIWQVPLIISQGRKSNRLLLTQANQEFRIPGCSNLPLIVNAGGQGFYRVQYAPEIYAKLVQEFAALAPTARIALLSDSFALVQTGQMSLSAYWNLLTQLPKVQGAGRSTLIDLARKSLGYLDAIYVGTPQQTLLAAKARQLLAPELKALGWSAQAGESSETQILRSGLISSLAHLGDESVLAQAESLFNQDVAGTQVLRPEIRDGVIYAVGMGADAARHARLLERLLSANSEEDRWRYAEAVAAVKDIALAQQVLELSLRGVLPSNIASRLPILVSEHTHHSALAYQFVLDHFDALAKLSGEMFGASAWLLPATASSFNTEDRAKQLLSDQQKKLGDKGANAAAQIAAQISLKAAIRQREPAPLAP
jgi:aminopeptidase N